MFAVTGATGQLGRKVVSSLLHRVDASQITAIARDTAKACDLGVAARHGDYKDKESMARALDGVDKLLLISSSSQDTRRAEHANVVAAAKEAGVGHVFYTSCLHAEAWGLPFTEDHLLTERWLKDSGIVHTILRNGWYWENNTPRLLAAVQYGALIGSAGSAAISWASRQDFADAAVAVMTGAGHEGKTYELAGDIPYTFADLATEAAQQSGRPVAYTDLSEADFAATLEKVGLPGPLALMVAEIEARGVSKGVLREDSRILSNLIDRKTQTIKQAVAETLKA